MNCSLVRLILLLDLNELLLMFNICLDQIVVYIIDLLPLSRHVEPYKLSDVVE